MNPSPARRGFCCFKNTEKNSKKHTAVLWHTRIQNTENQRKVKSRLFPKAYSFLVRIAPYIQHGLSSVNRRIHVMEESP